MGLVVPEEVGTGDLPMVALSDDVIDENESPVYGSPRTQMDSKTANQKVNVRIVESRNGSIAIANCRTWFSQFVANSREFTRFLPIE